MARKIVWSRGQNNERVMHTDSDIHVGDVIPSGRLWRARHHGVECIGSFIRMRDAKAWVESQHDAWVAGEPVRNAARTARARASIRSLFDGLVAEGAAVDDRDGARSA